MAMTFEQFVATRKDSDDLESDLNTSIYDDPLIKCPGLIYLDTLYIEKANGNWTEAARNGGQYFLVINNWDCISDDLPALERKLYEYAVSEGFAD